MAVLFEPIVRMRERLRRAHEESDVAYFNELLLLGEMTLKLVVVELLAALQDDSDRSRYGLEYRLVRADGLGEWAQVLEDVLQGPASQSLTDLGQETQRAFTSAFGSTEVSWQKSATEEIFAASRVLDASAHVPNPARISLRQWASQFVWLRNRTRGHGAPLPATLSLVSEPLARSLELVLNNAPTFSRSWAFLKRNLSNKYRVSAIGGDREPFNYLTQDASHSVRDGVHVFLRGPRPVGLLFSDPDLTDFRLPNGNYRNGRFEALSYITDDRSTEDGTHWSLPVDSLVASETSPKPELDLVGDTFSNIPSQIEGYVARPILEAELRRVLKDDRHPVLTLQGRGGVGKTSLALQVLHDVARSGDFFAVLWFSARDIDLLPEGPRTVRADVLSRDDVAKSFVALMGSKARKPNEAQAFLNEHISDSASDAPLLLVFDNFETLREQTELYNALSNTVRLPHKILITTRTRDFKADYPIEVRGMERGEFKMLVVETSTKLGIAVLVDESYEQQLFDLSGGHPYITKVLLGEVATAGKKVAPERVVATNDAMLDALFERTYAVLSPGAQRVFLTLCNWRSQVPRIGLEAALLRPGNEPFDVDAAIVELVNTSMVEETRDDQGSEFLSVPVTSSVFGKKKLVTSPLRTAVDADMEIIREFGAVTAVEASKGIQPRVERLARSIAKRAQDPAVLDQGSAVLQYIASSYAPAWLVLARLQSETGHASDAIQSTSRYLEQNPEDAGAWKSLADLNRGQDDAVGEIHARLQLAELPESSLDDLTDVAARLNTLLSQQKMTPDAVEKRLMVSRIRVLLEAKADVATGTDLSRLAWLCMHTNDLAAAQEYVDLGLGKEPENTHLLNLAARLSQSH